MRKQEFLALLEEKLSGLPQDDISERLAFYGEMIDDRMEDGLSEEEAIAEIGPVDKIVSQIVSETPISKLVREKVRPMRRLQAWEIILLSLGSPIWLSLLIALFAVLFSVYIVLWAVILSLWAVAVSVAVSALAVFAAGIVLLCRGDVPPGIAAIGAGLVLTGLSILFILGCSAASKGAWALTKKIALGIKSLFLRKENAK